MAGFVLVVKGHHVFTAGIQLIDQQLIDQMNGKENAQTHVLATVSLSIFSLCFEFDLTFRRIYWRGLENGHPLACPIGDSNPCFGLERETTASTRGDA